MNIEKILKKYGYKATKERISIFSFAEKKHIFSYNDISKNFDDIGRASIFRTLKLFLTLGIIRKINVGIKAEMYELNDEKHHHEHMKCEKCNDIINFDSENICKKILKEAKKIGFKVSNHSIGIYGTCKKCCQTKAILK